LTGGPRFWIGKRNFEGRRDGARKRPAGGYTIAMGTKGQQKVFAVETAGF